MQGYYFVIGVYKSAGTISLSLLLTKTVILEVGWGVLTLARVTTRTYSSIFTANTLLLATSVVLVVVQLSFNALWKITIGTGCEFYITIFLSVGNIPFTSLSMSGVLSNTGL